MKNFFKTIKQKILPAKILEKEIVAVIASYNNKDWYKKNLDSIFNQKYDNYKVIYIDDCSKDGTAELVKEYIKLKNQEHRTTLIKNLKNQGATANRFKGSTMANDNAIVVIIDGDDWLAHNRVFKYINKIYSTTYCWLTYGQFRRYPSNKVGHCKNLDKNQDFRKMDQWYASHLRTYYSWLFKKVKKEDLMFNGSFLSVTGDAAEMLPMLEMAKKHIQFIDKVLYIYNQSHEFNDFKIFPKEQIAMFEYIKSKNPYKELNEVSRLTFR